MSRTRYIAHRILWLIACLAFSSLGGSAQETADAPTPLAINSLVSGRIDDDTPRIIYEVTGTRGLVVEFTLTVTEGNLDPVLTVFDAQGRVIFNRDDYQGRADLEATMTFDDDGLYYVVVGRFGYALGSTRGIYELDLARIGILSTPGTTLQYGIPVTNTITNRQSHVYYTFQAQQGDVLNIEMVRSSGSLDPYLQVVDANRFLLTENDDADASTRNAAIDNLLIEADGTYIVVASRYREAVGDSVGGFVLLVSEAGNSGLGNNRRSPVPINYGQTRAGEITDDQPEQYFSFQAQENDIVTVVMERSNQVGLLDAYLLIADVNLQPLVQDDDSGSGKNARISRFRIPADGTYYVIATRFERETGTTRGEYGLSLQRNGIAFQTVDPDIPRLLYGTQVIDRITDEDSESLFAFWGVAGETVTINMNRTDGNLDPVLELWDADRLRILRDDAGGNGENARIEYTLQYTGVYYIRALRYDGVAKPSTTTGEYSLVLRDN